MIPDLTSAFPTRIALSWSGGKDAALAHFILKQQYPEAEISWFTVISAASGRVTMHGIRPEMIAAQAVQAGVSHWFFEFREASDQAYAAFFSSCCEKLQQEGSTHVAFGDLFLEDLKAYREELLKPTGLHPLFPIWQYPTQEMPARCEAAGIKAVLCAISHARMRKAALGQDYSEALMRACALAGTDWAGEMGEFHTWVYDAAFFSAPIAFVKGEIRPVTYQHEGADSEFSFIELLPKGS